VSETIIRVAAVGWLVSLLGAQYPTAPWSGFGPDLRSYELAIDTTVAFNGRASLLLSSLPGANSSTWVASHQIVDARPYRGKRVRISAHLRTAAAIAAGLWLSVDGPIDRNSLVYDSLTPILRGTVAWRVADVVFDVPAEADCIRYGSMLHGTGAVWLDAIKFEVVAKTVGATERLLHPKPHPVGTNVSRCPGMISRPQNLDFEEQP
jgi:hypothetical protein